MIIKLAHVCLVVRDLEKSLDFYERLFKLQRKFQFTRKGNVMGGYLEICPGNYIEFFENRSNEVLNTGITHFCLETPDIEALMRHLDQHQVTYSPMKLGADQSYQIWVTDPDGNKIEIQEYTENSSQRTGATVEVNW